MVRPTRDHEELGTRNAPDCAGDYQRQLVNLDHAGLPLKTVLKQLDLLGEEVVPVLRKEFASLKPAHVPDPTVVQDPACSR